MQGLAEFLRVYSLNHIVGVVLTLLTINPTTLRAIIDSSNRIVINDQRVSVCHAWDKWVCSEMRGRRTLLTPFDPIVIKLVPFQ